MITDHESSWLQIMKGHDYKSWKVMIAGHDTRLGSADNWLRVKSRENTVFWWKDLDFNLAKFNGLLLLALSQYCLVLHRVFKNLNLWGFRAHMWWSEGQCALKILSIITLVALGQHNAVVVVTFIFADETQKAESVPWHRLMPML